MACSMTGVEHFNEYTIMALTQCHTWNDRNVGVLSMAAVMDSAGTSRRHFRRLRAREHPVSDTMKSNVGWRSERFPEVRIVPDSIHAARNNPLVSPSCDIMWKITDWAPALCPQLFGHNYE